MLELLHRWYRRLPIHGLAAIALVLLGGTTILVEILAIISSELPSGWDRLPHVYLAERMRGYLSMGHISGYNPLLFAGYPEFTLYAPLFYILTAGLSLATASDIVSSVNLFTAMIPIAIILSFIATCRTISGSESLFPAIAIMIGYLSVGAHLGPMGLGFGGLTHIGLLPNYAAVPLFLLFVRELLKSTPKPLPLGLLLGLLIPLHSLTAVFTIWVSVLYLLWQRSRSALYLTATSTFLGFLLSSWWWSHSLSFMPYASGQAIGLTWGIPDPLFALLPGINTTELQELLSRLDVLIDRPTVSHFLATLQSVPVFAILLLLTFPLGFRRLLEEKRSFLPFLFVLSLIIVPRDYLSQFSEFGLHYYRFTQHIALLGYLIAARGGVELLGRLATWAPRSRFLVCCPLVVLLSVQPLALMQRKQLFPWQREEEPLLALPNLNQFPAYESAMRVARMVAEDPTAQRVATEASDQFMPILGSPHFFSTILPMHFGVPVLPGLLAESALSARYINPTLAYGGEHLIWGKYPFPTGSLKSLKARSIAKRYRLFGVSHIISGSRRYTETLRTRMAREIEPIGSAKPFHAFRLRRTEPLVGKLSHVPPAFIDLDGASFNEFAAAWYLHDAALKRPVFRANMRNPEDPTTARAEGYIVAARGEPEKIRAWLQRAAQDTKPYLFLYLSPPSDQNMRENVHFMPRLSRGEDVKTLAKHLQALFKANQTTPIPWSANSSSLQYQGMGPTIIRYSFSPQLETSNATPLYPLTPSLMFNLAEGATVIPFR